MEQLRKLIRKTLLENFLIKENLKYVEDHAGNSESVKAGAEEWAIGINNRGKNINFNFTKDSSDFNKTSYMLEILMYAIAFQNEGKFTFPTINVTVTVNPTNIAEGLSTFFFPSFNLTKFAYFISKGGDFSITADELERLDSYDVIGKLGDVLNNLPTIIEKYLKTNFTAGQSNFFNYLQTALRYPLRDLRKKVVRQQASSLDDPMGDGKKSRSDMMAGDEHGEDSYNDFSVYNVVDTEMPYRPDIGQKISRILSLNYDIYELIRKPSNHQFFYYRIIGEGGTSSKFGQTVTYKGIIQKYLNGDLEQNAPELKDDISKKAKAAAGRFFGKNPELFQKFKAQSPQSFNEQGELIADKNLIGFLLNYAKGTKETPLILLKRIRRDIQDFFENNPINTGALNQMVADVGLVNPKTNQPFSGMEYLNNLLKSRTSEKVVPEKPVTVSPEKVELDESLNEEMIYEELIGEGDGDELFSFNDIYKIAKATVDAKDNAIQETRNAIRKILVKNFIK